MKQISLTLEEQHQYFMDAGPGILDVLARAKNLETLQQLGVLVVKPVVNGSMGPGV